MKVLRSIFLPAALIALILAAAQVRADDKTNLEYAVKAAFICRFAQFVEWPSSAFNGDTDPIIIGVVGDDPFQGSLERQINGKSIGKRPLTLKHFAGPEDIDRCHILFVSPSETHQLAAILRKTDKSPTLTIGDTDEFCAAGGILQFVFVDDKIHFEIDVVAAEQDGLHISSRLLNLAKIYNP